jgi:hypothetical protein
VRRLLIPLLAFICASAVAQRGFGGAHFGGRFGAHGGHYRGWGGYPLGPLYWDSLFSDDSAEYPSLAPPVVVIQLPAQAASAPPAPQDSGPVQPLLIELRGGRYVRIGSDENSISDETDQQSVFDGSQTHPMQPSRPSAPPPLTVLVFRNGSREQVADYTIAEGILYAAANYYAEGSWNKPIALSSLDLPATVNENRALGVRFRVPAGPNQVIVGP